MPEFTRVFDAFARYHLPQTPRGNFGFHDTGDLPYVGGQIGFGETGVQDGHDDVVLFQFDREIGEETVDRTLGRAVGVIPAGRVVRDGPHAGRHHGDATRFGSREDVGQESLREEKRAVGVDGERLLDGFQVDRITGVGLRIRHDTFLTIIVPG